MGGVVVAGSETHFVREESLCESSADESRDMGAVYPGMILVNSLLCSSLLWALFVGVVVVFQPNVLEAAWVERAMACRISASDTFIGSDSVDRSSSSSEESLSSSEESLSSSVEADESDILPLPLNSSSLIRSDLGESSFSNVLLLLLVFDSSTVTDGV